MNRPPLEEKVSFVPFQKERLMKYSRLDDASADSIIKIIDLLLNDLESFKPGSNDEYFRHYNLYKQPLSFEKYFAAVKIDAVQYLKNIRSKLCLSHLKEGIALSILENFNLNYDCLDSFRKDWVFLPEIKFSVEFYQKVFPKNEELIFRHHNYDGIKNSQFYLPVLQKLSDEDPYIIQPHYIDKRAAGILIADAIEPDDKFLKDELKTFKQLLNKVVSDDIILEIRNNDY